MAKERTRMNKPVAALALAVTLGFTASPAFATDGGTAGPVCTPTTVHVPAVTETVDVPAVYGPTEYQFQHKNASLNDGIRWETDPNWNAESNEHSFGWHATGVTRPGALITPASTEVRIVTPAHDEESQVCTEPVVVPPVETEPATPVTPPGEDCPPTDEPTTPPSEEPSTTPPTEEPTTPAEPTTPPTEPTVPPVEPTTPPTKGHDDGSTPVIPPHGEPGPPAATPETPAAPVVEAPAVQVPEAPVAVPAALEAAVPAPQAVPAPAQNRGVNVQTAAEAPSGQLAYTGAKTDLLLPAGGLLLVGGLFAAVARKVRRKA